MLIAQQCPIAFKAGWNETGRRLTAPPWRQLGLRRPISHAPLIAQSDAGDRTVRCVFQTPSLRHLLTTKSSLFFAGFGRANASSSGAASFGGDDLPRRDEQSAKAGNPFANVVLPTAITLMLCNMDRICLSVAILPMSQEFGWAASMQACGGRRGWHASN